MLRVSGHRDFRAAKAEWKRTISELALAEIWNKEVESILSHVLKNNAIQRVLILSVQMVGRHPVPCYASTRRLYMSRTFIDFCSHKTTKRTGEIFTYRMHSVDAPSTKLQRWPFPSNREFVNSIATIQRIVIPIHPTTQQPCHIMTFRLEVKGYRDAILVKRSWRSAHARHAGGEKPTVWTGHLNREWCPVDDLPLGVQNILI